MNKKFKFESILNNHVYFVNNITNNSIKEFEKKYNICIPEYYKNFLIKFAGYRINDNLVFKTSIDVFGDISYVNFFLLEQIKTCIDNVLENEYDDIGKELLEKKIIYIADATSNGLPLGISTITGEIGIIDYEMTLDTSFFIIANNFDDFINGFEYNPDL